MKIECTAEVRKVGQGCFYTAQIEPEHAEPFSFVYDCGSDTKGDALETEIGIFQRSLASRGLDMLVLSHLDADHVNGLDLLLKGASKTKVAFLPYFTPVERLLCALRFPNEAEPSYYELLADPVEFLLTRGVETIVFLGPGEGGEEPPPDVPPDVPPKHDEKQPPKLDVWNLQDDEGTRSLLRIENEAHATNPAVLCKTDRQTVRLSWLWRFRFFQKEETLRDEITRLIVRPAPRATGETEPLALRAAAFLDAVETAQRQRYRRIREPLSALALVNAIRDEAARKAIKDAYGRITVLHNDVSLVLWHGPVRFPGWAYRSDVFGFRANAWGPWPHSYHRHSIDGRGTTGTMLTGDQNLKNQGTKNRFLQHYSRSLPDTAFFYLPHHGSHENWKAEAAMLLSRPACLASSGLRSKYGHPHLDVVEELEVDFDLPVFWSHERSAVTLRIRGST
jgi:beta-lactamase superfamily II metal-dependent hydrolase